MVSTQVNFCLPDVLCQLIARLRESSPAQKRMSTGGSKSAGADVASSSSGFGHSQKPSHGGGKIQVQGSSANVTHTINEDERTEFTRHMNAVLAGDSDVGNRLPFPLDTMQ